MEKFRLSLSDRMWTFSVLLPAGVAVELLALPQTRLRTLPALTQAGVRVQRLIPGAVGGTHAAAQVVVPPLARGTPLPLTMTFTLAFT